ncbi:MAG: tRNA (adenosine(37)-N6)-dimethylallyltransferase MiaA, partial [bacterium]
MNNQRCVVLCGPTATGKSRFLYESLRENPIHVISADSMQVYRGFNVLTATPSKEELSRFPHTGVNELSPS